MMRPVEDTAVCNIGTLFARQLRHAIQRSLAGAQRRTHPEWCKSAAQPIPTLGGRRHRLNEMKRLLRGDNIPTDHIELGYFCLNVLHHFQLILSLPCEESTNNSIDFSCRRIEAFLVHRSSSNGSGEHEESFFSSFVVREIAILSKSLRDIVPQAEIVRLQWVIWLFRFE